MQGKPRLSKVLSFERLPQSGHATIWLVGRVVQHVGVAAGRIGGLSGASSNRVDG